MTLWATCEFGPNKCTNPSMYAYPAMGGGWYQMCSDHGFKHRRYSTLRGSSRELPPLPPESKAQPKVKRQRQGERIPSTYSVALIEETLAKMGGTASATQVGNVLNTSAAQARYWLLKSPRIRQLPRVGVAVIYQLTPEGK